MKTGDASAEVWLHGLRHLYCCEVTSERKTPKSRARYFWRVEVYDGPDGGWAHGKEFKACRTFADGMRLSRRMADYLERKRIEKDRKK